MKTALLSLSLCFPLLAQAPPTMSLTYKDGDMCNAQVVELKGGEVKLKVFVLGGSMQITRKLDDFAPLSAYAIELAAHKPETFDDHFAMARRAVDAGLVPQAGMQARAAIEAVQDKAQVEAKRTEVRTWAADSLEKLLKIAVDGGRVTDAQHYLKLLSTRLPDLRSPEQLGELEDLVEALEVQKNSQQQTQRQQKAGAKTRTDIEQKLEPIQKKVAEGDKNTNQAIKTSNNTTTSVNFCEKAIDCYKSAWKALQALVEQNPDDADLARSAEAIGKHVQENGIRAALHAANMLTVRSDYKGAMDWCNRVLAFDPGNAEAKEMVRTIQIAEAAASSQWGWGWDVVGNPPPGNQRNH
jgi:tetratricopeptide (TPR) repeat protein